MSNHADHSASYKSHPVVTGTHAERVEAAHAAIEASNALADAVRTTREQYGWDSEEHAEALDAALYDTHIMAIAARLFLDPAAWPDLHRSLVSTATSLAGDPSAVHDLATAHQSGFLTDEQHAAVLRGLGAAGWPTT